MLLVVVHVFGRDHVSHVQTSANIVWLGVENLPQTLLRLHVVASIFVDHGKIQQRVDTRAFDRCTLLIQRHRLFFFAQQIQQIGQPEEHTLIMCALGLPQRLNGGNAVAVLFQSRGLVQRSLCVCCGSADDRVQSR